MSALPPRADIAPVNYGVRYSPESKHCTYFALAQMHSSRKRERSSILIFCCSIRFSHSRIFSALSAGIIFSGAVAFMRSVTCADAACARNIARVNGAENSVRRCGCTRVSRKLIDPNLGGPKWPSHTMQQLGSLLDHLVGERQKIHWQLDARSLCGPEVDDELVMRRLLERQISRPRAAQDPSGEAGRALHAFFQVGSIRHQAAVMHIGDIVFIEGWNMLRASVVEHALAIEVVSASATMKRASGGSRSMASNTPVKSSGSRTPSGCTVIPSDRAASAEAS